MTFTSLQDSLSGTRSIDLRKFSLQSQQQVIPLILEINAQLLGKIQPIIPGAPLIISPKTAYTIDSLLKDWRGRNDLFGQTRDAVIYVDGVVRHALGMQ